MFHLASAVSGECELDFDLGLRSNVDACMQLMDRDLLGTRRLAVVRDDFDRHQDRMHLDCVFSTLGGRCCIMLEVRGSVFRRHTGCCVAGAQICVEVYWY